MVGASRGLLQRYTSFENGNVLYFLLKSSLSLISTRFLPDPKQTSRCATVLKRSLAKTLLCLNCTPSVRWARAFACTSTIRDLTSFHSPPSNFYDRCRSCLSVELWIVRRWRRAKMRKLVLEVKRMCQVTTEIQNVRLSKLSSLIPHLLRSFQLHIWRIRDNQQNFLHSVLVS